MMSFVRRFALTCLVAVGVTQSGVACKTFLHAFDDVNDPADDKVLRDCRTAGRTAREAGATAQQAFDTYDSCTKEAGF